MKRLLVLAGLLGLLVWPTDVSAHAVLVQSSIADGAVLDVAPFGVSLRFSEPLTADLSSITLYDERSIELGLERPSFPVPDTMEAALPVPLRPGTYTLVYHVRSAADGHTSAGLISFSVGTGLAPTPAANIPLPATNSPGVASVAARWGQLGGGMVAAGGVVWLLGLLLPVVRQRGSGGVRVVGRTVWLVQASLLLLLLATLVELALRAADAGGSWAALTDATIISPLVLSQWGLLALARIGLAVLITPLVFLAVRLPAIGWLAAILAGVVLLTFSASGHAAAQPEPLFPIFADWVHAWTAAIWVAGVLALALAAWTLRRSDSAERIGTLALLVTRFSGVALFTIILVVITGVMRAAEQLTQLTDLWTTAYGRTLLVKLAVMGAALLVGAWHWRRSGPRLQAAIDRADEREVRRFTRSVGLESMLVIGVVLAASALVQTPHPVKSASVSAPAPLPNSLIPTVAAPQPLDLSASNDGLTMTLQIDDRRPGPRTFTAVISDSAGLITPDRVRLRFESLDIPSGQQIALLDPQPDRTFRSTSSALSLIGRWRIELQVRRLNLPDVTAEWTVEMMQ